MFLLMMFIFINNKYYLLWHSMYMEQVADMEWNDMRGFQCPCELSKWEKEIGDWCDYTYSDYGTDYIEMVANQRWLFKTCSIMTRK
jgi:hypothetical protein